MNRILIIILISFALSAHSDESKNHFYIQSPLITRNNTSGITHFTNPIVTFKDKDIKITALKGCAYENKKQIILEDVILAFEDNKITSKFAYYENSENKITLKQNVALESHKYRARSDEAIFSIENQNIEMIGNNEISISSASHE